MAVSLCSMLNNGGGSTWMVVEGYMLVCSPETFCYILVWRVDWPVVQNSRGMESCKRDPGGKSVKM